MTAQCQISIAFYVLPSAFSFFFSFLLFVCIGSFFALRTQNAFGSFARICSQILGKDVCFLISSPCLWIFIVLDRKRVALISQNSFHKSVVLGEEGLWRETVGLGLRA